MLLGGWLISHSHLVLYLLLTEYLCRLLGTSTDSLSFTGNVSTPWCTGIFHCWRSCCLNNHADGVSHPSRYLLHPAVFPGSSQHGSISAVELRTLWLPVFTSKVLWKTTRRGSIVPRHVFWFLEVVFLLLCPLT